MSDGEETKATTGEGEGQVKQEPETKAEPKPEAEVKGKGKEPESWEQKYKSLKGMYDAQGKELTDLKKERSDASSLVTGIEGLNTRLDSVESSLNLVTELVGESASFDEEAQERVKKARQQAEQAKAKRVEAEGTITQMGQIASIVGMQPRDEALKPAWEAVQKGDFKQAITLTTVAVQAKASSMSLKPKEPETKEAGEGEKEAKGKEKIKVMTTTPGVPPDWRSLSSEQKVIRGLDEHRSK